MREIQGHSFSWVWVLFKKFGYSFSWVRDKKNSMPQFPMSEGYILQQISGQFSWVRISQTQNDKKKFTFSYLANEWQPLTRPFGRFHTLITEQFSEQWICEFWVHWSLILKELTLNFLLSKRKHEKKTELGHFISILSLSLSSFGDNRA